MCSIHKSKSKKYTSQHQDEINVTENNNDRVEMHHINPDIEKRYEKLVEHARKNGHPDL